MKSWLPAQAGVLLTALVTAAAAHIEILPGRLIDTVSRSDLMLIAVIETVNPTGPLQLTATLSVEEVLAGSVKVVPQEIVAPLGLAQGSRQVLFLQRTPGGWRSAAPSGALFPTGLADDAAYRDAVRAIAGALHGSEATRAKALRAALIAALAASSRELRYYAALDLLSLGHGAHPLDTGERAALTAVLDQPGADPDLRRLLARLLSESQAD